MNLSQGVAVEEIDDEALREFSKHQEAFPSGFVRIQPYGQVFPRGYLAVEKEIADFEVRQDDIWISSFPKCGTTWTQEMVWNIVNNLDFEAAKKTTLDERIPFLELTGLFDEEVLKKTPEQEKLESPQHFDSVNFVKRMPSSQRRLIKTHLSFEMLPRQVKEKNPKLIYVTRNPRDAVISYYHHWRLLEGFTGL